MSGFGVLALLLLVLAHVASHGNAVAGGAAVTAHEASRLSTHVTVLARKRALTLGETAFVPMMRPGDTVPDFPLLDQHAKPLSLRRPGAAPTLVSFMYTRCVDGRMCPLLTAKFGRLQTLLAGTGIRLVEITLDPEHDVASVLLRYSQAAGARAGGNWYFARGRPEDVGPLGERLGVLRGVIGAGVLEHTEGVAVISGAGVLLRLIDGDAWSARDVAAVARDAAALPSNPLRRFAFALVSSVGAACGAHGAGGISLLGGIGIFAGCIALGGLVVVRLSANVFARDPLRPSKRR